ncbi:hypothetical protein GCM10011494_03330 [Novosphingobium endophyticum]|uniref:Uncharacterized protein n=1 Tax=Novosphingobium endophyticum TaxID=1955250 RepID=A0A916TP40_9SPHN|nr:hypothetical protein GCM10011494_03330 [Novosphingobium endophyticum]
MRLVPGIHPVDGKPGGFREFVKSHASFTLPSGRGASGSCIGLRAHLASKRPLLTIPGTESHKKRPYRPRAGAIYPRPDSPGWIYLGSAGLMEAY